MNSEMNSVLDSVTQTIEFIKELDSLKSIIRKTLLINEERYENTAEHSWHSTMLVLTMAQHSNEPIDLLKAIKMQLIHDIVEIDAGDTFCYATNQGGKYEKELAAAERIFGLLPNPQGKELLDLWIEFEAGETAESKFCNACDRLIPLIHNHSTEGQTWRENSVTEDMVRQKNQKINAGSHALWAYTEQLIESAVQAGQLPRS